MGADMFVGSISRSQVLQCLLGDHSGTPHRRRFSELAGRESYLHPTAGWPVQIRVLSDVWTLKRHLQLSGAVRPLILVEETDKGRVMEVWAGPGGGRRWAYTRQTADETYVSFILSVESNCGGVEVGGKLHFLKFKPNTFLHSFPFVVDNVFKLLTVQC